MPMNTYTRKDSFRGFFATSVLNTNLPLYLLNLSNNILLYTVLYV